MVNLTLYLIYKLKDNYLFNIKMKIILVILAIFSLLNITDSKRKFDLMGAIDTFGRKHRKTQRNPVQEKRRKL